MIHPILRLTLGVAATLAFASIWRQRRQAREDAAATDGNDTQARGDEQDKENPAGDRQIESEALPKERSGWTTPTQDETPPPKIP